MLTFAVVRRTKLTTTNYISIERLSGIKDNRHYKSTTPPADEMTAPRTLTASSTIFVSRKVVFGLLLGPWLWRFYRLWTFLCFFNAFRDLNVTSDTRQQGYGTAGLFRGWRVAGGGWRVAGNGWRVTGGGFQIYMKIKYYNKILLLIMI